MKSILKKRSLESGVAFLYLLIIAVFVFGSMAAGNTYLDNQRKSLLNTRQQRAMRHVGNKLKDAVLDLNALRYSMMQDLRIKNCIEESVAADCQGTATDDSLEQWAPNKYNHKSLSKFKIYDSAKNLVTDTYNLEGSRCTEGTIGCLFYATSSLRAMCETPNTYTCTKAVAIKVFLQVNFNSGKKHSGVLNALNFHTRGTEFNGTTPYDASPDPLLLRPYKWGDYQNEYPLVFHTDLLSGTMPDSSVALCESECGGAFPKKLGSFQLAGSLSTRALGNKCVSPLRVLPGSATVHFCGQAPQDPKTISFWKLR